MKFQMQTTAVHSTRRACLPAVRWDGKHKQKRCIGRLKKLGMLNREGMNAANNGRIADAMFQLDQALALAESLKSPLHQAKIHNSIALAHQLANNVVEARASFLRAEAFAVEGAGEGNGLQRIILRNMSRLERMVGNKVA